MREGACTLCGVWTAALVRFGLAAGSFARYRYGGHVDLCEGCRGTVEGPPPIASGALGTVRSVFDR